MVSARSSWHSRMLSWTSFGPRKQLQRSQEMSSGTFIWKSSTRMSYMSKTFLQSTSNFTSSPGMVSMYLRGETHASSLESNQYFYIPRYIIALFSPPCYSIKSDSSHTTRPAKLPPARPLDYYRQLSYSLSSVSSSTSAGGFFNFNLILENSEMTNSAWSL